MQRPQCLCNNATHQCGLAREQHQSLESLTFNDYSFLECFKCFISFLIFHLLNPTEIHSLAHRVTADAAPGCRHASFMSISIYKRPYMPAASMATTTRLHFAQTCQTFQIRFFFLFVLLIHGIHSRNVAISILVLFFPPPLLVSHPQQFVEYSCSSLHSETRRSFFIRFLCTQPPTTRFVSLFSLSFDGFCLDPLGVRAQPERLAKGQEITRRFLAQHNLAHAACRGVYPSPVS